MASLRTMVGRFRNELREGVAYVAFWKNGRSWGAEAFWLDPGYFEDYGDAIEDDDAREMRQIINTDPNAIIVNGYESCPFKDYGADEGASSVDFMMRHIKWRYEDHRCQLVDFYKDHCKVKDEFEAQPIITAKPVWKVMPGWKCDIRGITKYEDLPEACRNYIEAIEDEIEAPITMVSNGPGRHEIIHRESSYSK